MIRIWRRGELRKAVRALVVRPPVKTKKQGRLF